MIKLGELQATAYTHDEYRESDIFDPGTFDPNYHSDIQMNVAVPGWSRRGEGDDIMHVSVFRDLVDCRALVDWDGVGRGLSSDLKLVQSLVKPSDIDELFEGVEWIVWYNK